MPVYNDNLSQYIETLFAPSDPALIAAHQAAETHNLPTIHIQPEEGRFLQVLTAASNARKAVEIGTLGGYSGIWIARGLAPGGRLITLEIDSRHAEVAAANFARAGLSERVEIRLGKASETLAQLGAEGPFDFVFIDADKEGYESYLDWALEHVRPGGVIAAHNAFQDGSVAGGAPRTHTETMRRFNQRAAAEPRLVSTIFPAGDGTLVMVKQF